MSFHRDSVRLNLYPLLSLCVCHQALEEQIKQSEKECAHWKEQLSVLEQRKDTELQAWREQRDKLVGQLQAILVQKDKELDAARAEAKVSG